MDDIDFLTEQEKQDITEKAVKDGKYYDKVEVYENCTVEVLTNTKTGEVSVGWYRPINAKVITRTLAQ